MNDGMNKITPLDSLRKNEFQPPVRRLIQAQQRQHRSYHGHPVQQDMFAESNAIAAWSTVTCSYSGIEQAMKCLLRMRDIKYPKNHYIDKLFQYLSPEEKEALRVSYGIYRSLHDYIPPETVDCFLNAIDDGYTAWRYFLLDGKVPPTTHPGTMLEIWSALKDILLARVYLNHEMYSVEQRINHHLDWVDHIYKVGAGQRERNDIIRWMQESHKNIIINAYIDLFFHHAESTLDLIEVLPSTREVLNRMVGIVKDKWVDNDFSHFLSRAQMGEIVWNPDKNLFEKVSRSEKIKIKFIESEHAYGEYLLGHSVKVEFIESVPDYIEDFVFEPRVMAEQVGEDWSIEEEARRARKEDEERKTEIREYEGGNECEGYQCHINGTNLIIIFYDEKEWIVYRYQNENVPGVPHDCKHINGRVHSIREAIRAIEHWRRTEQKELELYRKHMWNRRGKRRSKARRGNESS